MSLSIFNPRLAPEKAGKVMAINVKGDGNCLARALSMADFGSEEHYRAIKTQFAEELQLNSDFYAQITLSVPTLLQAASVDGTWLAHDMCFVYANMKQCGKRFTAVLTFLI